MPFFARTWFTSRAGSIKTGEPRNGGSPLRLSQSEAQCGKRQTDRGTVFTKDKPGVALIPDAHYNLIQLHPMKIHTYAVELPHIETQRTPPQPDVLKNAKGNPLDKLHKLLRPTRSQKQNRLS